MSPRRQEEAARAGFAAGPTQGLDIFRAILAHPEGVLAGVRTPESTFGAVATPDHRIRLHNAEVGVWMREIEPAAEAERLQPDPEFPLVLMAGRHMDMNANTVMRDPAWNEGKRACTLAMSPADAGRLGFTDGQMVRVVTAAGAEAIELEVTWDARSGQVVIPHGFGLVYDGVTYGVNVNRLTKNTHRDFVGTPLHRYVPCRVEAL